MDVNDLRSMVTVVSLGLFVALVVWTWDRRRRDAFEAASMLPFADDRGGPSGVEAPAPTTSAAVPGEPRE